MRLLVRFVYAYVVRLGFLDGMPGLVFCGLLASTISWPGRTSYERRVTASPIEWEALVGHG